jgi:soluble cytochrome b562
MSSDERFIKIENALGVLAEHQARHAEEISELRAMQKVMTLAIAKSAEIQQASSRKIDEGMKESREGMKELREGIKELREAQRITEEKLHALIDTVDRIVRDRGSRP